MSSKVVEMTCLNCGAPVIIGQRECEWCHEPVTISTFNSVYSMPLPKVNKYAATYRKVLQDNPDNIQLNQSIAICYLKLKLFDKALLAFEKSIEEDFDNSETYFYAAICLLNGKRAFLAKKSDIDKIEKYLNAALSIEPRGIYYYFLAYIKYDFFKQKQLKTSPTCFELLQTARQAGYSEFDVEQLFSIIGIKKPDDFRY